VGIEQNAIEISQDEIWNLAHYKKKKINDELGRSSGGRPWHARRDIPKMSIERFEGKRRAAAKALGRIETKSRRRAVQPFAQQRVAPGTRKLTAAWGGSSVSYWRALLGIESGPSR